MHLIQYRNFELTISEEAYLVKPIRDLFMDDKSKNKEFFFSEISYLFFMYDPRSSYNYIPDLKEREKVIIEQEGLPNNFKPSKKLTEAIEWYKKLTCTTSSLLLNDTKMTINKIRDFLNNELDLNRTDAKDKPVYPINMITSAITQLLTLIEKLKVLENNINKEIDEVTRARGGEDTKTTFEDGFDF